MMSVSCCYLSAKLWKRWGTRTAEYKDLGLCFMAVREIDIVNNA